MAEDPMMVGAATVFVVTDIAKSTEHYRDVPGFTVVQIAGSLDWLRSTLPTSVFQRKLRRARFPNGESNGQCDRTAFCSPKPLTKDGFIG